MKHKLIALAMTVAIFATSLAACKKNTPVADVPEMPKVLSESKPESTADYEEMIAFPFESMTEVSVASDFAYEISDGKVTVTDYLGSATKIRVPETIEGSPVVAIGDGAFADLTDLKVLWIPDSVVIFGKEILKGSSKIYALRTPLSTEEGKTHLGYLYGAQSYETNNVADLRELDFLVIGGTPTELAENALYDCNDLLAIKLPSTVTKLASYSLYRCESLKYLNTEHLIEIAPHAMDYCSGIETLSFPSTLQSIGLGAFENCRSLRRLTIPFVGGSRTENTYLGYIFGAQNYGTSVGFYSYALEWVTVTEGIDRIDDHAFYQCRTLRNVTLPQSVKEIGVRAFDACESLTEINLPNQLTSIGDAAFSGCIRLKQIAVGEGLSEIGTNAFLNCLSLETVKLPATLTTLPNSVFHGCISLKNVDLGGVTIVGQNAFHGCDALEQVTANQKVKWEKGNDVAKDLAKK